MTAAILQPVVALALWSIVMLGWLVAVRVPALKKAGIDLGTVRGGNSAGLDRVLDQKTQWPAHNYAHLMEQPTLFYAVALVLALIGQGNGLNAALAWAYVAVRIAHSVVQATVNRVFYRFLLFALSSMFLAALAIRAALALL